MNEHDEVNKGFSKAHETDIDPDAFLLNYDTGDIFTKGSKFLDETILSLVGTSGSAIGAGKYAGHGFNLRGCDPHYYDTQWIIKKHIDWNNNVSQILIPAKPGTITHEDDEEKIAYRMMLRKIAAQSDTREIIKEHIERLLKQYIP